MLADMRRYFEFVLRHRLMVSLVCLLLSALALWSISRAVISTSLTTLFFGDSPAYVRYQTRVKQFANDDILIFGYEDPAPLSAASLARLEQVVRKLERLPDVARVESLLSAQRLWAEGETINVEPYADAARARSSAAGVARVQGQLRRDPMFRGTLIADDGRHAAVVLELTLDPHRAAENVPRLLDTTRRLFAECGFSVQRLHVAGWPALISEVIQLTFHNLERIFPLSNLVLLVVVLVIFRRLAPALLAVGVSLLSVLWTMGFSVALDRHVNITMSIVPAVILIVSFSDVIHLWSAFLLERREGKDRREALLASASDVGRACLLTSATTFVGFLCLSLIPTPAFRLVGVVLGFGVGTALLLAMTLTPVVLSLLRVPERRAPAARDTRWDITGWALKLLARAASGRPWLIIGCFALLAVASLAGSWRLNIDTDMGQRIDPDNLYRRDQDYFTKHFSGTNTLLVFVDARRSGGLLDPRLMARVRTLQAKLEARPEVDKVVSLVTLLERMHQALGAQGVLPKTRAGLAQYLLLFELSGGEDLERLINFDRDSMLLSVRLNDHGIRATHMAGVAAEQLGARLLGGQARVEATGLVFLMGSWLDAIVRGQQNGLLLSFLVIAVMMVFGLRSLRMGLCSMVPNLLPLLAMAGYCGWTMPRVDSDLIGVAMMAIGIGVDDTIHFLMRYRIEARRCADTAQRRDPLSGPSPAKQLDSLARREEGACWWQVTDEQQSQWFQGQAWRREINGSRLQALRRTFAFSGRAILLTTVVLVLGYLPFALSDYGTMRYMGTILPGVFIVALLADLLLVPAMVQVGWIASSPLAKNGP